MDIAPVRFDLHRLGEFRAEGRTASGASQDQERQRKCKKPLPGAHILSPAGSNGQPIPIAVKRVYASACVESTMKADTAEADFRVFKPVTSIVNAPVAG